MSSVFSRLRVNRVSAPWLLTLVVVLVGCAQAPAASTGTPVPAVSSSPATGVFDSKLYPYSIKLPAGWVARGALEPWLGDGAPTIDDPAVDWFGPVGVGTSFASAVRTSSPLATWVANGIAMNYQVHSSTCPEKPDVVEPVTIGGQPGTLEQMNCGILINTAYTVFNGYGYRFGFRDPAVHAATDPADKATFTTMLASVVFH